MTLLDKQTNLQSHLPEILNKYFYYSIVPFLNICAENGQLFIKMLLVISRMFIVQIVTKIYDIERCDRSTLSVMTSPVVSL